MASFRCQLCVNSWIQLRASPVLGRVFEFIDLAHVEPAGRTLIGLSESPEEACSRARSAPILGAHTGGRFPNPFQ